MSTLEPNNARLNKMYNSSVHQNTRQNTGRHRTHHKSKMRRSFHVAAREILDRALPYFWEVGFVISRHADVGHCQTTSCELPVWRLVDEDQFSNVFLFTTTSSPFDKDRGMVAPGLFVVIVSESRAECLQPEMMIISTKDNLFSNRSGSKDAGNTNPYDRWSTPDARCLYKSTQATRSSRGVSVSIPSIEERAYIFSDYEGNVHIATLSGFAQGSSQLARRLEEIYAIENLFDSSESLRMDRSIYVFDVESVKDSPAAFVSCAESGMPGIARGCSVSLCCQPFETRIASARFVGAATETPLALDKQDSEVCYSDWLAWDAAVRLNPNNECLERVMKGVSRIDCYGSLVESDENSNQECLENKIFHDPRLTGARPVDFSVCGPEFSMAIRVVPVSYRAASAVFGDVIHKLPRGYVNWGHEEREKWLQNKITLFYRKCQKDAGAVLLPYQMFWTNCLFGNARNYSVIHRKLTEKTPDEIFEYTLCTALMLSNSKRRTTMMKLIESHAERCETIAPRDAQRLLCAHPYATLN